VTGAGVPVGVISDSINVIAGGIATSQAAGDLPGNVVVIADGDPASDVDEGRAMAEIVYDTAPGIPRIEFATANGGAALKAARIRTMAAHGVMVIADDIPYLTEPFFQDGVVTQAVDEVKGQGVLYLASAGNRARQSWEGNFSGILTGAPPRFYNDFGGADTEQTIVSLADGARLKVYVQWAEPWGAATTDLNALLINQTTGLQAVATPPDDQTIDADADIGHNPSLFLSWKNTTGAAVPVGLRIWRANGTGTPLIKWMATRDVGGSFPVAEHPTSSPTINPDAAAAKGALAVAAIRYSDSGLDTPEPFSSFGPLTRLRSASGSLLASPEVRAKPELAGADGVETGVPGFAPFFGTSAAAPSVAGIAALLRSASPSLTPDQLRAILTNPANTQPCPPAVSAACGAGFVFADRAVRSLDSTPPVITGVFSPSSPNGKNGWYRTDPVVSWTVADPETVATACPATTITVAGAFSVVCQASSVGGPATATVTGKRDAIAPAIPKVSGLAKVYYLPKLPKPKAVQCRSADSGSLLASCKVTGVSVRRGTHSAVARATDNAGNVATLQFRYAVATRPDTRIRQAVGLTRAIRVTFSGSGGAGKRTYECRVDRRPFKACKSPARLTGLRRGGHTVSVRARDTQKTADTSPARATVVVR
jgi:subtilisin family serine protease